MRFVLWGFSIEAAAQARAAQRMMVLYRECRNGHMKRKYEGALDEHVPKRQRVLGDSCASGVLRTIAGTI